MIDKNKDKYTLLAEIAGKIHLEDNQNSLLHIAKKHNIRPLSEVERDAIEYAIHVCDGNIPKAAALLDVAPSTIYRKRATW